MANTTGKKFGGRKRRFNKTTAETGIIKNILAANWMTLTLIKWFR
jgi:hypothetical protein